MELTVAVVVPGDDEVAIGVVGHPREWSVRQSERNPDR